MQDDLIFIMTRCVRKAEHNLLYRECYKSIRKFYDNRIYIIDDYSDLDVLTPIDMSGVEIIQSEFPGAGEILPYYYMYQRSLGKKAVILQDSMFIRQRLELDSIHDYKFLWHFPLNNSIEDGRDLILELCSKLELYEDLYDTIFEYKWRGCFGSSMVISLDFLRQLQDKTHFLDILTDIKSRKYRCALERLLGICAFYLKNKDKDAISIFGNIYKQEYEWGLTYEEYLELEISAECPGVKVWNGR